MPNISCCDNVNCQQWQKNGFPGSSVHFLWFLSSVYVGVWYPVYEILLSLHYHVLIVEVEQQQSWWPFCFAVSNLLIWRIAACLDLPICNSLFSHVTVCCKFSQPYWPYMVLLFCRYLKLPCGFICPLEKDTTLLGCVFWEAILAFHPLTAKLEEFLQH